MIAAALVVRPEPGNAATMARLAAAGIPALALPLFVAEPTPWTPPDPAGFDAMLLTSAQAARLGGVGLQALATLPVVAVGAATAEAARAAGLRVVATGASDAEAAVAQARAAGMTRLLHLAGREHRAVEAQVIAVYRSRAVDLAPQALTAARGRVVLLHSPRAARRLAALIARDGVARGEVAVAALSEAVLVAAGAGWCWAVAAGEPSDAALVALVRERLTGRRPPGISGA